jgi:putative peptide maturation system protein
MENAVGQTVIDTLDYLMSIVRDGTKPDEANSGLRPLQRRHSDVPVQLVWEEEAYDRSHHYDALLNLPEGGTVSISYCEDRFKPWPLRGVLRWSDADLVRVNNNVLKVDQAIACLDFIWEEASITDRLVKVCLIQEELERNPIELSDDELQAAIDSFRRARRLHKAEDTHRWMQRRGVTYQELERIVTSEATIRKLRDNLVASRVADYFEAHSRSFDTAHFVHVAMRHEASAQELVEQLRGGAIDFLETAQNLFVAKQSTAPVFRTVQRRDTPEQFRAELFQSAPGSVLGPVRDEDGYALVRLLSVDKAKLDDHTQNAIKKILFEDWLEERRGTASIEWFWGNAQKTARVSSTGPTVDLALGGIEV